ncbi:MAG: GNAT family N-acetyltransferase [Conexivisphaera sp.]|nr:GNAT family N-acetyltransferase [TACK group archaeon]
MTNSASIRAAKNEDLERMVDLVSRLKRLNGEFDPLLTPVDDLENEVAKYLQGMMKDSNSVVLVLEDGGKVQGVLTAKLIDRCFYKPRLVGQIADVYLMPEYRRRSMGYKLIAEAEKILKSKGAEMIFAEFPAKNVIAEGFYRKMGFREITEIFAKETQ